MLRTMSRVERLWITTFIGPLEERDGGAVVLQGTEITGPQMNHTWPH